MLYERALLQFLISQQNAFHKDVSAAITTAQARLEHLLEQNKEFYHLRFNIALYLLADGSIEAAQADILSSYQCVRWWNDYRALLMI